MDEPIESEQPQPQPSPVRKAGALASAVAELIRQEETEREEAAAYAIIENEPKRDPSNPGGAFGKRIAARIVTGQ